MALKKNISEFNAGDYITRVDPVITKSKEHNGTYNDDALIGSKVKLLGILNGTIYISIKDDNELRKNANSYYKLPFYAWQSGWDFYEEPDFLEKPEKNPIIERKLEKLRKDLKKAQDEGDDDKILEITNEINILSNYNSNDTFIDQMNDLFNKLKI